MGVRVDGAPEVLPQSCRGNSLSGQVAMHNNRDKVNLAHLPFYKRLGKMSHPREFSVFAVRKIVFRATSGR